MSRHPALDDVQALTFDLFGTVLDLDASLTPFIEQFLQKRPGHEVSAGLFWEQWRYRQRLEQFQDTLMQLGHGGYLETVRRALVYVLRLNDLPDNPADVLELMEAWPHLKPFPEVSGTLGRLGSRYRLVVLSNGDAEFLAHLVENQIEGDPFHDVISVDTAGAFKPHPSVYRSCARDMHLELGQCLMVSTNSFDVVGARACGMRAAFVNRNLLPYEDTPYQPDIVVDDFTGLVDALL
ncbi:MAG: haloacid dehalogenase type II [Candidatus Latescibacterota bacterium]|nr:haloacid dehalogenase type II [Candidatus Latescibacterota bacterium]